MKQCFLIKTKNLEFVTNVKNKPMLSKFIEEFNAETHRVLVNDEENILDIKSIVDYLNKENHENEPKINYETALGTDTTTIEEDVYELFMENEKVHKDYLKEKYDFIDPKIISRYIYKSKLKMKKCGIILNKNKDGYYEKETA